MENTLENIKKAIRKMEPKIEEDSDDFLGALVLLAMGEVGTSLNSICDFIKIKDSKKRKKIFEFIKNLSKNGIIKNGKVYHGGWFDKKTGGIAFWLDVSCGLGFLKRV